MKSLRTDELGRPDLDTYRKAKKLPVVVVLDNIRSGLNVGAIFRTCDAFGIHSIYLCGITASPPNPEILKTALGATESVIWKSFNSSAEAIQDLTANGFRVLPVEQTDQSTPLQDLHLEKWLPLALVFGNEMRGVSPEVLTLCEQSIEIPQEGIKHSLNVATSAGIVLWECYRQYQRLLDSGW